MRLVDCQQGTDEWRKHRAGIATASEFAAILSKGKDGAEAVGRRNYRTRLVVERLAGRPIEEGFTSGSMRQGTEREPVGRNVYELSKRTIVSQVGLILHDSIECAASPDGLIGDEGGLELKCPELSTHLAYLRRSDAPPEYRAQIQGNLWLSERKWWDFASFNPDFPEELQLVVHRVLPEPAYIAQLEFMVRAFMDEVRFEVDQVRKMRAA